MVKPGAEISIALGRPLAMAGWSAGDVLAAAALGAPRASADPVDRMVLSAAAADDLRGATLDDYAPPAAGRRYSLASVRDSAGGDAVHVARGDFESVAGLCALTGDRLAEARRLARRTTRAGFRPWAIATAPIPDGTWSLRGVIPVKASRATRSADRGEYVFVRLWSALLRFLHWSWALLILILVATGLEIQTMALSAGTTRTQTGFFFGYVRLVHYVAGMLLAALLLARIADALFTRNRFEDWRSLIPLKSWRDVVGFVEELANYALLRNDEGKKYLSHDPLAQMSFTFIYLVMAAIVISGLSIYGLYDPTHPILRWFQWPVQHFGANQVRLFHVAMMWLIILFVPLHIYLVVRADGYAREGSLSAMLSGGRWIRKGARFEDEPEPEAVDIRLKG